jgi:tagatose 1,6-diphosphate aldolase
LTESLKQQRLAALSTPEGVIAATAIDQRARLRAMLAQAKGCPPEQIPHQQLAEFKAAIARVLSPYASAMLLDTEWGLEGARQRASACGLLLTYESDTFHLTGTRLPSLIPHLSVRRLVELGASGIKILVLYTPDEDPQVNGVKQAFVERIGAECDANDVPLFAEFVAYNVTPETRARIVTETMREFSKPKYRVDVLKVEFPFHASHSRAEAAECCRRAADVAEKPFIYLSAGVSHARFIESLETAAESGARFSGVLCGRAMWQDGIPLFVEHGSAALEDWLSKQGVENIKRVNQALTAATPWHAHAHAASARL